MRITRAEDLDRYDCLYVGAETAHALLSCSSRIAAETRRGRRVLVASLFSPSGEESPPPSAAALGRIGVDVLEAGLPGARERSPLYRSCVGRAFGRDPEDEACLERATLLLEDVGRRTRARHVCLPLGVGGHIDHRLAHEAGVRSFEPEAERDVLLYEDRPAAFVPGAVRVRLAGLGARLPPAASEAASSGLLRFLFRLQTAPDLRRQLGGVAERLRFTSLALREWSAARAWDPRRALGLRVQPIVVDGEEAGVATLTDLLGDDVRFLGYERGAAQYGRSLGRGARAERYWLRLPSRDEGGLATLPSSA
jgi:hypothetical protein